MPCHSAVSRLQHDTSLQFNIMSQIVIWPFLYVATLSLLHYNLQQCAVDQARREPQAQISASRWLNCARAILHCRRPTCTASDVKTQPLVHIAMVLTRWQNIWCYTPQHTTRRGGSHGQISTIKVTQDAYGASWRRSGR